MASKAGIVASLGERKLALPSMVNDALGANDPIKYLFSLLQSARRQADDPMSSPPRLRSERVQAGIEDVTLDEVPSQAGEDELSGDERASFETRAAQVAPVPAEPVTETISSVEIDALTRAQRGKGDSAHLLVMDMHKALNRLQRAVAGETLGGAAVYELTSQDRLIVQAFMKGLRRTAPLKFDHPGLGTTATRSGNRLVIQNDIGTTDAHVLVVHVEGLECTLTYTDVHLQRLLFFQSLFARYDVTWDDTRSVRDRTMEDGLYHLALGRYTARDEADGVPAPGRRACRPRGARLRGAWRTAPRPVAGGPARHPEGRGIPAVRASDRVRGCARRATGLARDRRDSRATPEPRAWPIPTGPSSVAADRARRRKRSA